MVQKLQARMKVNNKDIELNPFVESYAANVTLGLAAGAQSDGQHLRRMVSLCEQAFSSRSGGR